MTKNVSLKPQRKAVFSTALWISNIAAIAKYSRRNWWRLRNIVLYLTLVSSVTLRAQSPAQPAPTDTVGEETRKTYSRFLEIAPAVKNSLKPQAGEPHEAPATLKMPIPATEAERQAFRKALDGAASKLKVIKISGMDSVKAAPGHDAQLKRLLKNQEGRTPQPDPLKYLATTPLLAELNAGEDKDLIQVAFWNEVALNITANDHTPDPTSTFTAFPFEQVGPAKTSRALAIVHIAMFEAINATHRHYKSFPTTAGITIQERIFSITGFPVNKPVEEVSTPTAIAFAAYHTLIGVYPKKAAYLAPILITNLAQIGDSQNQKDAGQAIGEASAQAILNDRNLDGSEYSIEEPAAKFYSSTSPAKWKKDPLNADPMIALGAQWSQVRPFVGTSDNLFSFRPPVPPPVDLKNETFKKAFQEVHDLGGDPDAGKKDPPGNRDRRETKTLRTPAQTIIGIYWAYDATPLLCAPPRLYNMIATSVALNEQKSKFPNGEEFARYLALVNIALADAGIGAWEAKYHYRYPRPVTGIRDLAESGSPDKWWSPLGGPVSNAKSDRVNFTPPFPSYPSGHAVFGAALFEIMREYYGTDDQEFTFISDEYNGKNRDPGASEPRPLTPRSFHSFTEAEQENGISRIYLGIHWPFDATEGYVQGRKIGGYVFKNAYQKEDQPR